MKLLLGDCLSRLLEVPDNSVDAVITDPPYGTTACKWDSVIPFAPMWVQLKRVLKPRGVIVLFSSQPFTSALIMSNVKMFKYEWVWEKNKATGHLDSKRKPMKAHENMCVFYDGQPTYNPQGLIPKEKPTISKGNRGKKGNGSSGDVYGFAGKDTVQTHTNYPRTVVKIGVDMKAEFHPTQKPVALMEYLIKTYTNVGDVVLDFASGSGTTGIACINTGRDFICIEKDKEYFEASKKRIESALGR